MGEGPRRAAGRLCDRASRRHRVASLRGRRRRHERATAPLELRTGGAGRRQHRVPLFGGFCATGTIARTATNVRAGAVGPVSGILHAVFLLAFMLVAAPLAAYIPLAALAGILAVV